MLVAAACSSLPDELTGADLAAEPETGSDPDSVAGGDRDSDSDTNGDGDGDSDSDGDQGQPGGRSPAVPGPTNPTLTEPELTQRLAELNGTLAVVNGFELRAVRPDGAGSVLLGGSQTERASQPTWSRDGTRLGWAATSAEGHAIVVQDFGPEGLPDGDPRLSEDGGNPVFYFQWNHDDQRLAYIRNATTEGLVEVGTVGPGAPLQPIGEGAPFFISWAPEDNRIIGHVNERSIDLFRPGQAGTSDGFVPVLDDGGGFSVPAWIDGSRALIAVGGELAYLDVETGETQTIISVPAPVRFVLSPDRTAVAYRSLGGIDGPSLASARPVQGTGPGLMVLDLTTGEQTTVTERPAAAWEWSPDSTKLAWLDATITTGRATGNWRFWSVDESPATTQTPDFTISGRYGRNYLPFFAQYAQSVTGWSPDSSAYAFGGAIGPDGGIWVQLVTEVVAPRLVAGGEIVTWGPTEVPLPPSAGPSAA